MAQPIRIKRGTQANIPDLVLSPGEFAVSLDEGNLYIGVTTGKIHLNPKGGLADVAKKLEISRNFSISGDVTATAKAFDGAANVILNAVLPTINGLAAGVYTKMNVNAKGQVVSGALLEISDIPDLPYTKITGTPTNVSNFNNDAQYQTKAQLDTAISSLINTAPETLDTLKEIANALGNDPNFASTIFTQLATKESLIKSVEAKATITEADTFPLSDSTASQATKKVTFTLIKSTLKTYFDTLYNKYVHPSFTAKTEGLYKVTVNNQGHIAVATTVVKEDITALGIPAQDTVFTLPNASASVKGGVKIGAGLKMAADVISLGDIDGGTF